MWAREDEDILIYFSPFSLLSRPLSLSLLAPQCWQRFGLETQFLSH